MNTFNEAQQAATAELEREQGIVPPGEQIAQEAPEPQLPAERGRLFDRAAEIKAEIGGLRISTLAEVMDVAKLMSQSGQAVPAHCRGNMGMCFAVCLQALEWRMSPFAVANKSYVTNDRINYESQLVHAVIEARAPLRERLRVRYEGEGDEMICIVSGWLKGEAGPREHKSRPLSKIRPPHGDKKDRDGNPIRKGSPLWDKKPEVQMFYDTSRDWCRIYTPDVLMGIYTPDEIEQYGIGEDARDISEEVDAAAALHQRLTSTPKNGEGFREGVVEASLQEAAGEPAGEGAATTPAARTPAARTGKRTGGHGTGGKRASKARAETKQDPTGPKGRPSARTAAGKKPATEGAIATSRGSASPRTKEPSPYPATAEGYTEWLTRWLTEYDDPEEIEARWKSEFKLRKHCGVGGGEAGTALLRLKNARVQELS